MNLTSKRGLVFTIFVASIFVFSGLSGCSKEGKKAKNWKRGEQYFSENKFREAIIEYKNVLQLDPKDASCRYKLGLSHLRAGEFREAFTQFSKSVELNKDLVDARLLVAAHHRVERRVVPRPVAGVVPLAVEPPVELGDRPVDPDLPQDRPPRAGMGVEVLGDPDHPLSLLVWPNAWPGFCTGGSRAVRR